jgi:hypothetical protein
MELVHALAVPGHVGANKLLAASFDELIKKSKDPYDLIPTVKTMVRAQHPRAADAVVATITKHAKGVRGYAMYMIVPLILELPKDAVPKLEAMLPGLPEKVMDQVLDHVTQLKNKA